VLHPPEVLAGGVSRGAVETRNLFWPGHSLHILGLCVFFLGTGASHLDRALAAQAFADIFLGKFNLGHDYFLLKG
jgi:hypothetical protein